MGKKALVLSGGSIKGAFQAGAINQVLNEGFQPDIIHGISVGSLNGSFLANESGKTTDTPYNWPGLGQNLVNFWKANVKKPSDLIIKKGKVKLGFNILTNNFDGIVSTAPLKKLVKKTLSKTHLINSRVDFTAGAVDMVSGGIKYFNVLDNSLIEGIIASTAIPVIMPLSDIGGTPYYDGGLRDVAPLKNVIEKGADEIVIILCQSEHLSSRNFNTGNVFHLVSRIMDIVVNEIVNNDIQKMKHINDKVPKDDFQIREGEHLGKRKIRYRLIRPQSELKINIDHFTSKDINEMIALGRLTAEKAPWMV